VIDTPRLTSRPLGDDDLPFLVEMYADETATWAIGGNRTPEQVRQRLDRWKRHWDLHGWGGVMFFARDGGERIGWGGLQHSTIDGDDLVTVGYVVRPDRWNQGYATEITVASLGYGFDALGLERIHASVEGRNAASRRVLEKAGMTVERELDHGELVEVIYVIRAPEERDPPSRARARRRPT
jgi:RimJ/RimL family protein N-acetyltransferase